MRNVTKTIRAAFERRQPCKVGNTHTDGTAVYLHGNKIVERRDDGVYVSNAGWPTRTTNDRLSAFCTIWQRNWNTFINGNIYEGGWVRVAD